MKTLGTTKISYEIEELLDSSENYLIIVSPYLKLNNRLKVKLSDAFKKVEHIYWIYRENELKNQELIWLKSFHNLNIFSIKNLHSKIYVNQEFAIITSMNLYEYSQINNHEIGVKLELNEDRNEYLNILNEVRIILESEYDDTTISNIIESFENYYMGSLFWYLTDNYSFRSYNSGSPKLYKFLCDKAREIIDFKDYELYQDKTAVLRTTNLGKERYEKLKKHLIKIAN